MKRFIVLDGFRGIGALSIAIFHLHIFESIGEVAFFRYAYLFVNFFFVLSGFVFFYSHRSNGLKKSSLGEFFINKTFRLYPLHVAMLSVIILIEFGKLFAESKGLQFNSAAFTGANSPNEIIPNLLLVHSWLNGTASLSFNHPSWFISTLYYVYFIFYLIVGSKNYKQIFIAISIISGLGLSLADGDGFIKLGILEGFFCFSLGCIAYWTYEEILNFQLSKLVFDILEATLLGLGYVAITTTFGNKGVSFFLCAVLFWLIVVVFSFERGFLSSILKMRGFAYLGKISFSVYMVHAPIIFCVISCAMIGSRLLGVDLTMMSSYQDGDAIKYISTGSIFADNLLFFVVLSLIVFVSDVTHKYVELRGIAVGKRISRKYFGGA